VLGTETMDYAVDEGVQIHGGYGFLQDFPIERAYRDSRVQRIFEGTNEINRLLIPEMLFRRALKGELPLMEAAGRLQEELLEPDFDEPEGPWAREEAQVANLKKLALMIAGLAVQKFGTAIEEEQEVLLTIGDLLIDTYAAESGVARARKTGLPLWGDMARLYLDAMLGKALLAATGVLPRVAEGDDLSMYLSVARRLTRREPFDRIGVQREVAAAVLAAGGYPQPAASRAG